MRTLIPAAAALLALAGCNQPATTNAAAPNTSAADADEPDITEVPDESADANSASDNLEDGNEAEDDAGNAAR